MAETGQSNGLNAATRRANVTMGKCCGGESGGSGLTTLWRGFQAHYLHKQARNAASQREQLELTGILTQR